MEGSGDHEALMAALMANRQLLEAKVAINNAILTANDVPTSPPGDFFVVGECDGQKTIDGEQVPLVLTPAIEGGTRHEALVAALRAEREWLEGKVVANSAVLLRGFGVRDAAEFDAVVEALGWPDIRYVGPAPRTHVHGRVWTANEGPLEQSVYFHHEMVLVSLITLFPISKARVDVCLSPPVFMYWCLLFGSFGTQIKEFPEKVILFCEVPPPEGGETPFVPSFRVTERALEEFPDMVEELDAKGLRYTFTAPSNNNTGSMRGRGWEDAFATSDKAEAEKRYNSISFVGFLANFVLFIFYCV
jgi:hypothetical protein